MSALLTAMSRTQSEHLDTIRRQNAKSAYLAQQENVDSKESLVKRLEALLLGHLTPEEEVETIEAHEKSLHAGQMKPVALPLGQSLEDTIDHWKRVRSEAFEEVPQSSTDASLAAKASAEIRQAESVIALHNRAKRLASLRYSGVATPFSRPNLAVIENKIQQYAVEQYSTLPKRYEQIEHFLTPTIYASA